MSIDAFLDSDLSGATFVVNNGPAEEPTTGTVRPEHDALFWAESRNDPNAVSRVGAKGRGQVMDDTAADPGFGVAPLDPSVPDDRDRLSREYFDAMERKYGNTHDALVAYNRGPGNADAWIAGGREDPLPAETTALIERFNSFMEKNASPPETPEKTQVAAAPEPADTLDSFLDSDMPADTLIGGESGALLSGRMSADDFLGPDPDEDTNAIAQGFKAGTFGGNPKMFGNFLSIIGRKAGLRDIEEWGKSIASYGQEEAGRYAPEVAGFENIRTDSIGNFLDDLGEYAGYQFGSGVGSTLPSLATGALGAGVGFATAGPPGVPVGATTGALLSSYPQNTGDAYDGLTEELHQHMQDGRVTQEQVDDAALVAGGFMAALDAGGAVGLLRVISGGARKTLRDGLVKRIAKAAAEGAAIEGLTEAGQSFISQWTRTHMSGLPLNTKERLFAIANEAIAGTLAGGGLAAIGGVSPGRKPDGGGTPPPEEQAPVMPDEKVDFDDMGPEVSAAEPAPEPAPAAPEPVPAPPAEPVQEAPQPEAPAAAVPEAPDSEVEVEPTQTPEEEETPTSAPPALPEDWSDTTRPLIDEKYEGDVTVTYQDGTQIDGTVTGYKDGKPVIEITDDGKQYEINPLPGLVELERRASKQESIDAAATETEPEPSDAQIAAENYRKGHERIAGRDISIETPKGGVRRSKPGAAQQWEVEDFPAHYGHFLGTKGADGDPLDVFIGDDVDGTGDVYVIDQVRADSRKFDELKVLYGFKDQTTALDMYKRAFSDDKAGDRIGAITPMSRATFEAWLKDGQHDRPFAYKEAAPEPAETAADEPSPVIVPTPNGRVGIVDVDGNIIGAQFDSQADAEHFIENEMPGGRVRKDESQETETKPVASREEAPRETQEAQPEPTDALDVDKYVDRAARRIKEAGKIDMAALREALGLKNAEVRQVLDTMASRGIAGVAKSQPRRKKFNKEGKQIGGPKGESRVRYYVAGPKGPQSLVTYLVAGGGINDRDGILGAMGALRGRPGLINKKSGRSYEDMADSAHETGYFPEMSEPPSKADGGMEKFWEAVELELAGTSQRYTPEGQAEIEAKRYEAEAEEDAAQGRTPDKTEDIEVFAPGEDSDADIEAAINLLTPEEAAYYANRIEAEIDTELASDEIDDVTREVLADETQAQVAETDYHGDIPFPGLETGQAEEGGSGESLPQYPPGWGPEEEAAETREAADAGEQAPAESLPPLTESAARDLAKRVMRQGRTTAGFDADAAGEFFNYEFDQGLLYDQESGDRPGGKGKVTIERRGKAFAFSKKALQKELDAEAQPLDESRVYEPTGQGPAEYQGEFGNLVLPFEIDEQAFREIVDEWAALFEDPAPGEAVNLTAGKGKPDETLTVEEAQARIDTWKADVERQFEENRGENANKTILSLFDLSGQWSKPWRDAGYNVITFDLQTGQDVHDFSAQYFIDNWDFGEVYGILAACPCTEFASSGARWFADKDADGRTEAAKELVFQTLRTIEFFRPQFWALENPVGRIKRLTGLPQARLTFNPNNFGDPYTKKTLIYGKFNADVPTANVEPTEGSKMHQKFGGKSLATKNARSETPEGFTYAFWKANNYQDLSPEQRLVGDYPEVAGAVREAFRGGVPEERIRELMYDTYENYEYDAAVEALAAEVVEPETAAPTLDDQMDAIKSAYGRGSSDFHPGQSLWSEKHGRPIKIGPEAIAADYDRLAERLERKRQKSPDDERMMRQYRATAQAVRETGRKDWRDIEARMAPATEMTDQGEQVLMPGVAPITDRDRIESQMDRPLEGGTAAPPEEGLFGEGKLKPDLFDQPAPAEEPSDPDIAALQNRRGKNLDELLSIAPEHVAAREFGDAMRVQLRAIANRISPRSGVIVHDELIEATVEGRPRKATGRFTGYGNLIEVALAASDPEATVRHEGIHALKSQGLFTREEWSVLEREAKRSWMARYKIPQRYPHLTEVEQIEEAIADAYSQYRAGERFPPGFRRVFQKIIEFLSRLGNWLNERGFQTFEDVFNRVESGRVGERPSVSRRLSGEAFAFITLEDAKKIAEEMTARTGWVHYVTPLYPHTEMPWGPTNAWAVGTQHIPVTEGGTPFTEQQAAFQKEWREKFHGRDYETDAERLTRERAAEVEYAPVGEQLILDVAEKLQIGWHGGPHDFDAFSTKHVGTGEGAQAYGWGLYFATKREVAEFYRNKLSGSVSFEMDGQELGGGTLAYKAIEKLRKAVPLKATDFVSGQETYEYYLGVLKSDLIHAFLKMEAKQPNIGETPKDAAMSVIEDRFVADPPYEDEAGSVDLLVQELRRILDGVKAKRSGRLYRVNLAPAEDEYLYWDRPLSEQSEKVKAALGSFDLNLKKSSRHYVEPENRTGEWAYRTLSALMTAPADESGMKGWTSVQPIENDKAASLALADAGIPGIKYLDGDSANAYRIEGSLIAGYTVYNRKTGSIAKRAQTGAEARRWVIEQGTHNYVIFDDSHIQIEEKLSLAQDEYDADPNLASARSKIGAEKPTIRQRIATMLEGDVGARLQHAISDDLYGFKMVEMAGNEGQLAGDDKAPYQLARVSRGTDGTFVEVMHRGAPFWDEGTVAIDESVKAPMQVLDDVEKAGLSDELFELYLTGLRAQELNRIVVKRDADGNPIKTKENNFNEDEIAAMVALGEKYPAFKQHAADLQTFNRKFMDFVESSGLIDKKTRQLFEQMYENYIPFYRITDKNELRSPKARLGFSGQHPNFYRLSGAAMKIDHPLINMERNIQRLLEASVRNRVMQLTDELNDAQGGVWWSKVGRTVKTGVVSNAQMVKDLREQGLEIEIDEAFDSNAMRVLWTLGNAPKGDDIVSFVKDGKVEFRKVHEPILYKSAMLLSRTPLPFLAPLRIAKRTLTAMVGVDPSFQTVNAMRDPMHAAVTSHFGFNPLIDPIRGFKGRIMSKTDPSWHEFMAAGGGMSSVFEADRPNMQRIVEQRLHEGDIKAKILDSPRRLLGAVEAIAATFEYATRMGGYKRARDQGMPKLQAAYQARDISTDFAMRGTAVFVRLLAETVPFWNAGLQGLARGARGVAGPQGNMLAFFTKGGLITLASIGLYLLYRDDERYRELNDYQKDNYWWFWVGDQPYKIPKPFEVGGIFATLPVRMLEFAIEQNGELFAERFMFVLSEMFRLDPVPQLFRPPLRIYSNWDEFRDRPVVPQYMQNRLPAEQYSENTKLPLIAAGRALDVSPMQLDTLIYGYLGAIGAYSMSIGDTMMRWSGDYPVKEKEDWFDRPVFRRFMGPVVPKSTQYLTDFYEMRKEANDLYGSMQVLIANGEVERARRMIKSAPLFRLRDQLNKTGEQIGKLNKGIRAINRSRELSAEEKRERIDTIRKAKSALAKSQVMLKRRIEQRERKESN